MIETVPCDLNQLQDHAAFKQVFDPLFVKHDIAIVIPNAGVTYEGFFTDQNPESVQAVC